MSPSLVGRPGRCRTASRRGPGQLADLIPEPIELLRAIPAPSAAHATRSPRRAETLWPLQQATLTVRRASSGATLGAGRLGTSVSRVRRRAPHFFGAPLVFHLPPPPGRFDLALSVAKFQREHDSTQLLPSVPTFIDPG
jgi:hypothetical protein